MTGIPTAEERVTESLELAGRRRLVVERISGQSVLRMLAPDGRLTMRLDLTEDHAVLSLGSDLAIQAAGALELVAEHVTIRGREGVLLDSGGDARIAAAGDLTSEARTQNIRARLGDVNLKANDDVRLRGERIRLNC